MKKKILALAMAALMLAVAVVGGTLAYFTDTDQNTNEFAIGNVKIDLYEDIKQTDGITMTKDGKEVDHIVYLDAKDLGKGDDTNPDVNYENIQPGHVMTKIAHVENVGQNDAYVALVIKQENYLNFNQNVDEYYENLDDYGVNAMQDIIDDVFPSWNLLYDKTQITDNAQVRYTIDTLPTSDDSGVKVLGVGYAQENVNMQGDPQYHYSGEYFTNVVGQKAQIEGEPNFFTISDNGAHDRVWIVYLALTPGAKFDMDLTTVCPTYFDNSSTSAFENMTLDVKAFAIQSSGFTSDEAGQKAAFAEALKPGFGY